MEHQLAPFVAQRLTQDPHAAVRLSAARVLGTLTSSADVAVPALIEALQERDGGVRLTAAASLGRFGTAAASAVPALQAALNDPNPQVRTNAAQTLQAIQDAQHASVDDGPRT